MEMSLDLLRPGKSAVVIHIGGNQALRRRLRDFGMVEGTRVCCRYRNPWGDVTAIGFRGSVIALRNSDLRHIRVRVG